MLHKVNKTIYGKNTKWSVISQNNDETLPLLKSAVLCPAFSQYKINHIGIMDATSPYEVLRINQSGTFFLACITGAGEILIDGSWQVIKAGQACVFPPFVTNALRAQSKQNWKFAWVRYKEDKSKKTIANTHSPIHGEYNSEVIETIFEEIKKEISSTSSKPVTIAWVNLLHQQVLKFTKPTQLDDRLLNILSAVAANPGHDWTLYELAEYGNMSSEHLRRLTNLQLGRSPMQQIIFMRMMYARKLLSDTKQPIETIAKAVGYSSAFSFSNTFYKWMGYRPSTIR